MDAQGIEAAIMLPSLAVCIEHPLRHDLELTNAVSHAFNRWVEDEWGYAFEDRIYGVPLVSLRDVATGCAELERVLERGARMAPLQTGPVDGRSPADPHFAPFWSRVEEAEIRHVMRDNMAALLGLSSDGPRARESPGAFRIPQRRRRRSPDEDGSDRCG